MRELEELSERLEALEGVLKRRVLKRRKGA
jgi:hypothetical protein